MHYDEDIASFMKKPKHSWLWDAKITTILVQTIACLIVLITILSWILWMEKADMGNAIRSPSSTSSNPRLRVYSADETQADDYIEIYHDQTDGHIEVGVGNLFIGSSTGNITFSSPEVPNLSSCGTTPSIAGTGNAGKVTIGTGATTSCTVTFDTAYTNAPSCTITGDDTAITYAATTTTSALTITSSADMQSDIVSYICFGY